MRCDLSVITIFTLPINRPVFVFGSNATESPTMLKSARRIVERSCELKIEHGSAHVDLEIRAILRRVGRDLKMLETDMSIVDPSRYSCFKLSPQMTLGVEIGQDEALRFVTDRKRNISQTLLARRSTR